MKPTAAIRSFLAITGSSLLAISYSHAANLYWDGLTPAGAPGGGNGTWNLALTNWDNTPSADSSTAWVNANLDTAVFGGTAGTVNLGTNISVGGLRFDTTGYVINTGASTLSFGTGDNTILFNNATTPGTGTAATITGAVGGTGNVILSNAADRYAIGTLTLNGASTGGWSGSTTINAGMTLALAGSNRALFNTSGITLNGGYNTVGQTGGILLTNTSSPEAALNRVSDSAPIISNGGFITVTNSGATTYSEDMGALDLRRGQLNVTQTNSSGTQTLTFGNNSLTNVNGSARTNATTSAINFSGASLGTTGNSIKITSQATTGSGEIIAPWATFGNTAGAQNDYAVYNRAGSGGASNSLGIQGAAIAASAQSTWSTAYGATSNYTLTNAAGTATQLTATRRINTLRNTAGTAQNITSITSNVLTVTGSAYANGDVVTTGMTIPTGLARETVYYVVNAGIGGAGTFQLAATPGGSAITGLTHVASSPLAGGITLSSGNNLETYGILNGSSTYLGIGASGTGAVTTPTGGGNLYLTTGAGPMVINAPITDNGGAVTLVRNGGVGRLILSGNNTFTGGLVVNGGSTTNSVTLQGTQSFMGGIILNGGGIGEQNVNNQPTTNPSALNGNAITVNGPSHLLLNGGTLGTTSTITINAAGVLNIGSNGTLDVQGVVSGSGLLDAGGFNVNAASTVTLSNSANTFTGNVIYTNNNAGPETLNVNSIGDAGKVTFGVGGGAIQVFALNSTATSGMTFSSRQFEIAGNSAIGRIVNNSNQAFTINTDLLTSGTGARTLQLQGTGAGLSTFAGKLTDGSLTSLAITKAEAGTWVLSGLNEYTGKTAITGGTLNVNTLKDFGTASSLGKGTSGTGIQMGTNGSTTSVLNYTGTGDSTNRTFEFQNFVSGNNVGTINNNGSGALIFNATTWNTLTTSFTKTYSLTLGGSYTGSDNQINGVIQNDSATDKLNLTIGGGTWRLGGSNTYTGTTTVSGGTLSLNYSTNNTSKLADASALTLGSATVNLTGTSGNHVEVVASTTLTAGTASYVTRTGATTATLQLGAITQNTGTLDIGTTGIATTTNNHTAGTILGTWLTVGGADWGVSGATGTNPITAYTGYTDVPRLTPGVIPNTSTANVRITEGSGSPGNITLAAATTTINTLNQSISGGTGATTITLASQTLLTNGILMGPTAGALTIGTAPGSGTLKSSAATGSIVVTNNSGNTLTINSVIANNTTTSLVKNGTGVLVLTATSTYTGGTTLLDGTIQAGASTVGISNGILGSTNNNGITIANKSTALFDVNGYYVAVKDLIGGGSLGGNVTLGSGTLYIGNAANSATPYAGIISGTGGNLIINGSSSWNTTSAHTYTGTTTIGTGAVTLVTNNLQDGGVASGMGASTSAAGNLVFTGGTLRYTNSVAASTNRQFTVGGNAGFGVGGAGAITWSNTAAVTYSGAGTRALFLSGDGTGLGTLAADIDNNVSDATSVTKSGTSNWMLTNAGSAFTGAITLNTTTSSAGTLSYASAGGANAITFNQTTSTATLSYTGSGQTMSGLIQANTLSTGTITLDASGAGAVNYSNTNSLGVGGASGAKGLVLSGTNTGNNTLAGLWANNTLGGAATLTKNGIGTWAITSNNTFSGALAITGGTLMLGNSTTNGGIQNAASIAISSGATLAINRSSTASQAPSGIAALGNVPITGAGSVLMMGGGGSGSVTMALANTYTGGTTLQAGTLNINSVGVAGTSGPLGNGGTFTINGGSLDAATSDRVVANVNPIAVGGNFSFVGTNNLTLPGAVNLGGATRTITTTAKTLTLTGVISNGALTKSGAGTLTLSGANSYTGTTTAGDGVLKLENANALPGGISASGGTSNLTITGGGIVGLTANSGNFSRAVGIGVDQLQFTGSGGFAAYGGTRTVQFSGSSINWTASNFIGSGNTLILGSSDADGTVDWQQAISMSGATRTVQVNNGSAAVDAIMSGAIAGGASGVANGFTKTGTGTLALTSNSNSHWGPTTVSNGTLTVGNGGADGILSANTATVSIASGATLAVNRNNAVSQAASGGLGNGSAAISGDGSFHQAGSGTTTLTLTNSYTGATTVSSGTLIVNGNISTSSLTTVQTGATLKGQGTVGALTVNGGGTLASGTSIESLATGNLTLLADAIFEQEIDDAFAGGNTSGDLTAVTGTLNLALTNDSVLNLIEVGSSGLWSAGNKITLISYTGAWNGGLFEYLGNVLNDGDTITFSGIDWEFDYNDTLEGTNYTGDSIGTFVTMTAVPEPRAALLGGIGMLLLLRRRRQ